MRTNTPIAFAFVMMFALAASVAAQQPPSTQQPPPVQKPQSTAQKPPAPGAKSPAVAPAASSAPTDPGAAALPPGYVLGPDDIVHVEFWRDKDMSADATVRPDGKITLPLLNDIHAGGLTPDQLRDKVLEEARRLMEDPSVTVTVKEIKSRKVFITGEVNKPGAYVLNDRMTVLQLIAIAGGLTEFAKSKDIVIMRSDPGREAVTFPFNYKEVLARKNLKQNIELRPGDTVIVP